MRRPKILQAFTNEQFKLAHQLLGTKVAYMMGRKMEEGDWADVYCRAKGIPNKGWSNLKLDVVFQNLGIEQKMLCRPSNKLITDKCGERLMHPSATRSIRMPPITTPPDEAMVDVITQYGDYLNYRRQEIKSTLTDGIEPDMRTGLLLWQASLHQFLYFEEETLIPDPKDFYARWETRKQSGARKGSTNLWVYEKETDFKRYSITNEAGAKVQPYFDIPPLGHENLYVFNVIGEFISTELVRLWATEGTARELKRLIGSTDTDTISRIIIEEAPSMMRVAEEGQSAEQVAEPILITIEAYKALRKALPEAISDEHSLQLFAQHMRHKQ